MSLSICCIFFSKIFLLSTKPIAVFPNEFGPELVGVFLPIFLILILHSAGISSSSSLSSLNALATDGFKVGNGAATLGGALSFNWMPVLTEDFKFTEIFGAGGAFDTSSLRFLALSSFEDDDEVDLDLDRCRLLFSV